IRIREAVRIAGLMNDLRIDIPLAVLEWLIRRKLRAVVGAHGGKIALIDADTQIPEKRIRVHGRRQLATPAVMVLRQPLSIKDDMSAVAAIEKLAAKLALHNLKCIRTRLDCENRLLIGQGPVRPSGKASRERLG